MSRSDRVYENAKRKSVGSYIAISYNGETVKISTRKLKKLAVKAAALTIAVVALCKVTPAAVNKVSHYFETRDIALESCFDANSLLAENNLYVVPVDDEWRNDYSKIKGLSENDLYGMYNYLGYNEAEEVVRALGYESWDNYLSMKGYFDSKGNPSIQVWKNYEESRLIAEKKEVQKDGRNY